MTGKGERREMIYILVLSFNFSCAIAGCFLDSLSKSLQEIRKVQKKFNADFLALCACVILFIWRMKMKTVMTAVCCQIENVINFLNCINIQKSRKQIVFYTRGKGDQNLTNYLNPPDILLSSTWFELMYECYNIRCKISNQMAFQKLEKKKKNSELKSWCTV